MIKKEEIITCKSYLPLCDYHYDAPDLDNIPPTGLVHVPLDHIEEFFKRVDSNGHRYVVVSSCSDYGLAIQQEHAAWQDMVKWIKMQVGPSFGYSDLEMPARIDPNKCSIQDNYSVKCHSWTRATIPKIPHNVHHWFLTNLMFVPEPETYNFLYEANTHEKMTAIPFGIAEGKQRDIVYTLNLKKMAQTQTAQFGPDGRKNKIYISWNDYTYERYDLRQKLIEWSQYADNDALTVKYPGDGQDPYDKYLQNLATHKYVVSPPGNGVDCYRTLEAIYMGCAVLVEDNPTNHLTGLPVHRYKSVEDIISLYNANRNISNSEAYNNPRIKLSYWKNIIEEKRDELF
tara:strand:- start:2807 stop:3835 length:1029 start_codon:yes stop_codon:yes gene_type:complete